MAGTGRVLNNRARRLSNRIKDLISNRDGSVAMMTALLLPVILAFVALSVEYGNGLLVQVSNQRVADAAAYAGALAFSASESELDMVAAAQQVADLNGVDASGLSVVLVTSPRDADLQAVRAVVATHNTLLLAPILGVDPDLTISAAAYASISAPTAACIIALDPASSGVTLSGGVGLQAENCSVASNAGIIAPCGTFIVAEDASYSNGAVADCLWAPNILKPDNSALALAKHPVADPLDGSAAVANLAARFEAMRSAGWPSEVSVTAGTNLVFGGSASPPATALALASVGCSYDPAYYSEWWVSQWVVSCTPQTINLGSLFVAGGVQVSFDVTSDSNKTYNFSGSIQNQGTALSFGNGQFNVANGVAGATISFGAGSFHIGRSNTACDGADYSICASGTVGFGGPSTFVLDAGFFVNGGARLTLGAGTTNRYAIGAASNGEAITLSGGAIATMADATGSDGVFRVDGNVNGGGGGSCLVFPAAAQHDIAGYVHLAGGAKFGAGIYTIDGYLRIDTGGANCGTRYAVDGTDVVIVISGTFTPNDWACAGRAFCLSGGNDINLVAPTTGPNANLAVIGPQDEAIVAGAALDAGGQAQVSGAFYFPHGPIDMTGGASLGGSSGGCLQLIGSSITLSGGTKGAYQCVGANSTAIAVTLVQ